MKRFFFFLLLGHPVLAQKPEPTVQQVVWSLTEVMFHDVVNPPAAARFYAYSLLTGYEILTLLEPGQKRFQDNLINYPPASNVSHEKVNTSLTVLYGILETGKHIIPSGYLLEQQQAALAGKFTNLTSEEIDNSISLAREVARKVILFSKSDGYFKLSVLKRYQPLSGEGSWQPTPPEYMAAVEPNWRTIRTFFLDSAQQCKPLPMTSFAAIKSSDFYKLAQEVYDVSQSLTTEQKLIANFWDCNPFAVQFQGHMSVGLKKISPGGHWMGITGIACKEAALDFSTTLFLHTILAMTLHDAFICCWDEKFRSNRVRPETVIHRYLDEKWQPLLQTPPFPEYPSGHSVISTAAAEVLTHFIGTGFHFTDTVETYIGLPPRKFASFDAAAGEARISRLYGGIHFRDAIENGGTEGAEIGRLILRKLGFKNGREQ